MLFVTTADEIINLAKIVVDMHDAGLDKFFIANAFSLARSDQGIYDLMLLWQNENDLKERDNIVSEIESSRLGCWNNKMTPYRASAKVMSDLSFGPKMARQMMTAFKSERIKQQEDAIKAKQKEDAALVAEHWPKIEEGIKDKARAGKTSLKTHICILHAGKAKDLYCCDLLVNHAKSLGWYARTDYASRSVVVYWGRFAWFQAWSRLISFIGIFAVLSCLAFIIFFFASV